VLNLLQPAIVAGAPKLRAAFQSARPFRHLVVDGFLRDDFCRALCSEFPPFEKRHAINEVGAAGGKAVVESLPEIGPAYLRFDELIRSKDFLTLAGEITGIDGLLYDPHYFGGGTHENLDGQDLDLHVDFNYHPKTRAHRRLNLIVFLNTEWDESWGGCLELHENPWGDARQDYSVSVLPLRNRCVIFETTERSWHGFRRIRIPPDRAGVTRRSIAVYFYTKDRPAAEIAPRHSTVYVPERLPERFQAGYQLTADDIDSLALQIERRDRLIRYLYEREKEMTECWDSILESAWYRSARLASAPLRAIKNWIRPGRG
jgi:hypothetical protein